MPFSSRAVGRFILVGQGFAAGGGAGQAADVVVDIADGVAGFVGSRFTADQVVAEADVVGGGRIGPAQQTVQVVVAQGNALAVTFAQAGDVAVGIVGHLFEVGRRGHTGGDFVRIQGFQFAVVTIVLVGGQLVFGILDGHGKPLLL